MNPYVEIPYLYEEAMKAKKKGEYQRAAQLFIACHNLYQSAELPIFDEVLKKIGEDALDKYEEIPSEYLDGSGFDSIIYGV